MMRIAVVAGEMSGDQLGAGLVACLRRRFPDAVIEGVAGKGMVAAGAKALFSIEALSVMGLVEVLRHLPRLLKIKKKLLTHWEKHPPDVFIGIDYPDFNFLLARQLKMRGVPTVHYVSPSVWAWRERRVIKIKRAVDLMLTLFPFETEIYQRHGIPVRCVGHPLADEIPTQTDRKAARARLGLAAEGPLLALLPGSRGAEVQRLAADFLATAQYCQNKLPALQVIIPAANAACEHMLRQALATHSSLPVTVVQDKAREAIIASDVVLCASGTATLEAMLCQRPMVVAYKLSPLTVFLLRYLVKINYMALPNLLADDALVPEFLQAAVQPEAMGNVVLDFFRHPEKTEAIMAIFAQWHQKLRQDASARVSDAVADCLQK